MGLGILLTRFPFLAGDNREIDEEVAKEWEHTLLQDSMDKELHELNKRLEEKEVYIYIGSIHINRQALLYTLFL